MKKKSIALCMALLLCVGLLAACGGSGSSAAPPASGSVAAGGSSTVASEAPAEEEIIITDKQYPEREDILIWFWGANEWQRAAFQKNLVDVFNKSQDKYEIIFQFANSVDTDIPVALAANEGPDIIYSSGPSFCNVYANEGKLLDLTPYSEKYGWKDRLLPALYDACLVGDQLYSLPNAISVGGVFYNKGVLEDNGWAVPTTVEEMETIMDGAIEKGMYGSAAGNRNWRPCNDNFSSIMVNHFASPTAMYDSLTGAQSFNNPDTLAAITKTKEWYEKGYLGGGDYASLDTQDCMQLLADGKTPFFLGLTLFYQFANNSFTEENMGDFGFMPFPNASSPDKIVYDVSMPCAFSINAKVGDDQAKADACAAILDILMTPEYAQSMTEVWPGYWMVPLRDLTQVKSDNMTGLSLEYYNTINAAIPMIDAGQFGYHPSTFFPPATQEAWRNIDAVWQGEMEPEEFLDIVQMEAEVEREKDMFCPLAKPSV